MAGRKLEDAHRQFIINQRAQFVLENTTIARRLGEKKFAEEFGFEPVKIDQSRIWQILQDEAVQKEIDARRQKWLADFADTPFAHKKNRILELVRLYEETEKQDFATYSAQTGQRTNSGAYPKKLAQTTILKQIKDEIGEDIDKLADALKAPLHIIYEERIEKTRAGLRAFGFDVVDNGQFKPNNN